MGDQGMYDDENSDEDEGDGEPTLYDLLYCSPDATDVELKQAYKQQALHWHPDKNDDPEAEERFKQINQAWMILSDDQQRAAYNRSLAHGDPEELAAYREGRTHDAAGAAARRNQREYYEAFCRAEEEQKKREIRRERGLLVGVVSLAIWVVTILILLWQCASESAHLFPRALTLSNREFARLPLNLDFKALEGRLIERHRARLTEPGGWGSRLMVPDSLGGHRLRTHTPYVKITLNRSSEVRRAPEVGRPSGRGWLLMSANKGEDIYGRPLDLVSNTLLHVPRGTDLPAPWPSTSICARLLHSGNVKQKEWWTDLSRATGGRLRHFALALAPASECAPDWGLPALAGTTVAALLAAQLSVRMLVPR